jgi:hypothetical protein
MHAVPEMGHSILCLAIGDTSRQRIAMPEKHYVAKLLRIFVKKSSLFFSHNEHMSILHKIAGFYCTAFVQQNEPCDSSRQFSVQLC